MKYHTTVLIMTHKREESNGTIRMIPVGQVLFDVELVIDMEALARHLGTKAAKNKTGRSNFSKFIRAKARPSSGPTR